MSVIKKSLMAESMEYFFTSLSIAFLGIFYFGIIYFVIKVASVFFGAGLETHSIVITAALISTGTVIASSLEKKKSK